MSDRACPTCGKSIPPENMNVSEGVALCGDCGALSRMSELLSSPTISYEDAVNRPPKGCAIYDRGNLIVLRASLRSMTGALMFGGFALFWNSIVSMFLALLIVDYITFFTGSAPAMPSWVPASGSSSTSSPTWGNLLFNTLFMTPFIVIGIGMVGATLISIFGRIEVILSGIDGVVRTGIGPFNWTKRFDTSKVRKISADHVVYTSNNQPKHAISLIGDDSTVRFGSMLADDRKNWMRTMLTALILNVRK